jgi:hypothetical protein
MDADSSSMTDWLFAFALTVAVELPLVMLCAPRSLRRRAATDSVLANLLTHPLAWLAIGSQTLPWTAAEIAVVIVEAVIYCGLTGLPLPRATLVSLVANGVTAALSFVV